MTIEATLKIRSENKCELCSSDKELNVYAIPPVEENNSDKCVLLCSKCLTEMNAESPDVNHWRCLNDSAWSAVPAVQVVAWRMLHKLSNEGWANDLRDMLYLEEDTLKWAKLGVQAEGGVVHKDSNGATLSAGDTIVLIKDLNVKGAGFTAKRGTAVRNISLVHDNAEHIEGRVNGQQIVILTQYVKKN
ncbi:MAG: PhnA domain-containing protein [Bacteroidales bacterium]